jgi:hypothetical protein
MSALGQKQTLGIVRLMSTLPPKADIGTSVSPSTQQLRQAIHKALAAAARRRSMKLETIMLQLVGGTVMRGSIDPRVAAQCLDLHW